MRPLLQVRDLAVRYSQDDRRVVAAIDELRFDIAAGEAVGLLGESGCGKTTLGMALLGLLPPTGLVVRGSVVFQGIDLLTLEEFELQKIRGAGISMVHQEPGMALHPVIQVVDQIAEVLRAHRPLSMARSREEARAVLAQVGFKADSGIDHACPHQLSGGQRQRVAIAQAIACHPALIVADEPTTGLDVATQASILTLLKKLQAELRLALLWISHDPSELAEVADRILVMYAGRLIEEGPALEVTRKPLHPYTQGLLRARISAVQKKNQERFLPVIPGEAPDPAALPVGCAFEPRCPHGTLLCRNCRPRAFYLEPSHNVACFNYVH